MKSSFRSFTLRFAATVILFAPAAVQAQGIDQSVCRDVWDWGSGKYMRVCNSVYYPPPAPAAGLSVFRMGDDGKLTLVRKYDIDVGSKTMFWMGMVPL